MPALKEQIDSIWLEVRETVKLRLDYAKLTGAEKLTTLLSALVLGLIVIILASIVIFLISVSLIVIIAHSTGVFGACLIMAGVYAILLAVLFALRKQLIINPIARFISALILK